MCSHSCFYRSLVYLHALITIFESGVTIALFLLITTTHRELFFKSHHPTDDDLEMIDMKDRIIIVALFFIGALRTIVLFIIVVFLFILPIGLFPCMLCIPSCLQLLKAKSVHRLLSFSCNCPCYRARPKRRFQLQFIFIILVSCVRIAMIAYCLAVQHNITMKNLAVIVAISFIFLLLTTLLDIYHYCVWWHYKPHLTETDFKIPDQPLSPKHKRFIPYTLLGDNRTMRFGDKPCLKGTKCNNRELEHIFIFHFKGYNPQPRYFDIEQRTPGKNLYIGFHQTDPKSAMLIAHSDFLVSTNHRSTMIGHGVYFARSREGTERKANRHGAFICAEIYMGRVLRIEEPQRNFYRGKNDWWQSHDTAYFCHGEDSRLDEFCVKSPDQILKWIIVIEEGFDTKVFSYRLHSEFNDTKCLCI